MSTHHTLGSIQIPRGMVWVDEMNWSPVESSAEYGLTGARVVDVWVKTNGRPITLEGSETAGWITRQTLLSLRSAAAVPDASYLLTLADGRTFTVRFAPDVAPIEARPIARPELPPTDFPYVATVRLESV